VKAILSGPQVPQGVVRVSGAKNSATRVLAAALLSSGEVTLRNFPTALKDVKAKTTFIRELGVAVDLDDACNTARIQPANVNFGGVRDFAVPIRTTYLLAAAGLLHEGRAYVPYPAGCKIGSRGYDMHVMVWKKLGCFVEERAEYIEITGRLHGNEIDFPISTVGGTENALICGVVAQGETLVRNAYVTPEISDLIHFLSEMGAIIKLEGTSLIRIQGLNGTLGSTAFSIMPDRIEALTWMILAAASGGSMTILDVPFVEMEVPLLYLRAAGIDYFSSQNAAIVGPNSIGPNGIQPFELACGTHPGVHSDMQSFFVFLALFARGRSVIHDFRYPSRIGYAQELEKMVPGRVDAQTGMIRVKSGHAPVGANLMSTDLRSSMALLMTAICSEGTSVVDNIDLALRGYNKLPEKLAGLGVKCEWQA